MAPSKFTIERLRSRVTHGGCSWRAIARTIESDDWGSAEGSREETHGAAQVSEAYSEWVCECVCVCRLSIAGRERQCVCGRWRVLA